ncbi:MAG: preprotein translocase subunit YajC [Spirochaetaceae bacterium]|nr:preprotein translocase subunit YajC [Spirochaetaceae bacterium]
MFNNFPLLLGAPAAGGAATGSSGSYIQILMIVGVFAVFYLLIIRPQRKKQKDTKKMLEAVKKGDKVTSIGGIRGTVKNVLETTVIVDVDNKGATLEFSKSAIGSVDTVVAPAKASKEDDSKDSSEKK